MKCLKWCIWWRVQALSKITRFANTLSCLSLFWRQKRHNCETQLISFHWQSSSIFIVCRLPRNRHTSSLLHCMMFLDHTKHIFSVRIWSWQHVSANISSVAELSPVYCCLVSMCATYFWGIVSTNNLVCRWMPPHAARYDKTDSNRQSGRWSKLKWSKTQNFLQNAETNLDALPAVVLKGVVVIMIYHQMVLVGNFD